MTRPSEIICLLSALLPASAAGQVTYQDLLKADPSNWLTYSGSYNSQRHSLLKQINAGNAQELTPKWIYHVPGSGRLESVPIVVDGVMYVSQPNEVFALDGRTGRVVWKYRHEPALGKGPNRGVAVYANRVYFTTPDAFLVALDARTGNLLWQSEIAKFKDGYWSPAAPLVLNGKIITGVAPGDPGPRIAAVTAGAVVLQLSEIPPGPQKDEAITAAMRFLDAGIATLGPGSGCGQ